MKWKFKLPFLFLIYIIMKAYVDRYKYNKEILEILSQLVDDNKDLRFIQMLHAFGIIETKYDSDAFGNYTTTSIDKFKEESNITLDKLKNKIKFEKD